MTVVRALPYTESTKSFCFTYVTFLHVAPAKLLVNVDGLRSLS